MFSLIHMIYSNYLEDQLIYLIIIWFGRTLLGIQAAKQSTLHPVVAFPGQVAVKHVKQAARQGKSMLREAGCRNGIPALKETHK